MPLWRPLTVVASGLMLAVLLLPDRARGQGSGLDKETAQDVMRASTNGVAGIEAVLAEINDLRAVASAMSRDVVLAQKVLDLARRGDRVRMAALLQPLAPRTKLEVTR
jgi:uncharacterized protein (DUF4213/DUF364 family)